MGGDATQLYDSGSLENDYHQDYPLQVLPFSLGIASFFFNVPLLFSTLEGKCGPP